jgi:hypothetical protein
MPIVATPKQTLGKLKVPSFNLNRLAINQSISQLFPSRFQYAMEGRPRNSHLLSAFFLL